MSLATRDSKNHPTNSTKIVTQSTEIIIQRLKSVVSQRESVKTDKPPISMSLSHCIHQTLNSKASTRFHSGALQQYSTLMLTPFFCGVIIIIANIFKKASRSQLASSPRSRLLFSKNPLFRPYG